MNQYRLKPGESLAQAAVANRLSGWQGLYFADVNRAVRERYPDPWALPAGIAIAIPGSAAEQERVLTARLRSLEKLEREVRQLAAEQIALLSKVGAGSCREPRQEDLAALVQGLVTTTLQAIRLLTASDHSGRRIHWDLAWDARGRWSLDSRPKCLSLLSLLARAAQDTPWRIPAVAARGWCDAASPHFWGKTLVSALGAADPGRSSPWQRRLDLVRSSHQVTLANVVQQVSVLRTGAMMELNHLARLADLGTGP